MYKLQHVAARVLQAESMKALDSLEAKYWKEIELEWTRTRFYLRSFIVNVYHHYFKGETWDIARLQASGGARVLWQGIHDRLALFKDVSAGHAKAAFNALYKESILRHAWVLDQTSPPSFKVRIPHRLRLFESGAVRIHSGPNARVQWGERWAAWVTAYEDSLHNNIRLGAINGSSAMDAAAEVDATRAGTPNSGLLDSLQRLFSFETVSAMNDAIHAVSDVNEQMDVEEIWQTRDDADVDEICADNEGESREDASDEIPAHPNCRCYWRVVPKEWAAMLKDGTEKERQAALDMDSLGLVPNSMVISDDQGNIAGHAIVTFQKWTEDMGLSIGTSR